jgi:hypothetical protein
MASNGAYRIVGSFEQNSSVGVCYRVIYTGGGLRRLGIQGATILWRRCIVVCCLVVLLVYSLGR